MRKFSHLAYTESILRAPRGERQNIPENARGIMSLSLTKGGEIRGEKPRGKAPRFFPKVFPNFWKGYWGIIWGNIALAEGSSWYWYYFYILMRVENTSWQASWLLLFTVSPPISSDNVASSYRLFSLFMLMLFLLSVCGATARRSDRRTAATF